MLDEGFYLSFIDFICDFYLLFDFDLHLFWLFYNTLSYLFYNTLSYLFVMLEKLSDFLVVYLVTYFFASFT